jgi:transcriptional regulator with XRE-family HTH domain
MNKEREPPIAKLVALADYFDVSLDYLVGRSDNPETNR